MRFKKSKLRFALDEGVPNAVGRILEKSGHKVTYLNKGDVVPRGSKDTLVCAFAIMSDQILVAIDGDMKVIARTHGASNSQYTKLNLLKLSCTPPEAASRVLTCPPEIPPNLGRVRPERTDDEEGTIYGRADHWFPAGAGGWCYDG